MRSLSIVVFLFFIGCSQCGSSAAAEVESSNPIGVRISFQGAIAGNNVATILGTLYDRFPDLPLETYQAAEKDTLCGILESRGYPPPCEPYLPLIDRINKTPITKRPLQANSSVILPGLKVVQDQSIRVFSKSDAAENNLGNQLIRNWKDLGAERIERNKTSDSFAVKFTTYNLLVPAPDDSSASTIFDGLVNYRSKNVVVNLLTDTVHPEPALHSYRYLPDPEKIKQDCQNGVLIQQSAHGMPLFRYSQLMDGDQDALSVMRAGLPSSPARVAVTLIDTVLSRRDPANGSQQDTTSHAVVNWSCKWNTFIVGQHHANHLAGIIETAGPLNLFEGISDNVDISGISWWKPAPDGTDRLDKGSPDRGPKLASEFVARYSDEPLPIFVAATDFEGYVGTNADNQLLNSEKRFGREPEQTIRAARPLLIVAAGQPASAQEAPVALTETSAHSPQNLGNLENVVVVTACSVCGGSAAKLYSDAHFSAPGQRMVHIAAPGADPIAGWIDGDSLGAAGGTSQATAIVAGLAASMISQFHDVYKEPRYVKLRLQATSRPISPLQDDTPNPDANKISAGIVDPILARLNPSKHWVKQNGIWKNVNIRRWTTENLNIVDTSGKPTTFKSAAVLRMVKTRASSASLPAVYSFYIDSLKNQSGPAGAVDRYDFISQLGPTSILLCDGTTISLDKLDDIILSPLSSSSSSSSSGLMPNECRKDSETSVSSNKP